MPHPAVAGTGWRDTDNKAGGWIMAKMAGIPIEQWAAAGRDFMFGEHRLRYWEAGSGEPLLRVHGFPRGGWDCPSLGQPLAEGYRVIACDMLGFGFSAKPRGHAYGLLEQADIQHALLSHLCVEQYHVLAHDYGDRVAQDLLAREREGASRLRSGCFLEAG